MLDLVDRVDDVVESGVGANRVIGSWQVVGNGSWDT